jgi:ribosomal protein S12 methylthiotransferase accessory factor
MHKRYRLGTHRLVAPEETISLVRPHLAALGITRIGKVTGLDFIGIPCIIAIRPAARNLTVTHGKGLTDEAAFASGLMEALECSCADTIKTPAAMASIEAAAADSAFLLPSGMMLRPPPPAAALPWTEGRDLFTDRGKLVPSELVFADFSAPASAGQGYFIVTTNGLASGNGREEALLHALCEVIERDAVALWTTARRANADTPTLAPESLAGAACRSLLDLLANCGLRFEIWDVTSDIAVPCYVCVIDDSHLGGPACLGRVLGSGCHPNAEVALCRAMTEAAQCRLTIIVGARDDVEQDIYRMMGCNSLFAAILPKTVRRQTTGFEDRSIDTDTVAGDLDAVLDRLTARGIETVLGAELPCPIAAVSCMRVLVPELEGMFEKSWYRPGRRARALAATLN